MQKARTARQAERTTADTNRRTDKRGEKQIRKTRKNRWKRENGIVPGSCISCQKKRLRLQDTSRQAQEIPGAGTEFTARIYGENSEWKDAITIHAKINDRGKERHIYNNN